jgi:hypothetical protein
MVLVPEATNIRTSPSFYPLDQPEIGLVQIDAENRCLNAETSVERLRMLGGVNDEPP